MNNKDRLGVVRVKDPVSELHLVCLHPSQGFQLVTSEHLGAVEVDIKSNYFALEGSTVVNKFSIFDFKQKYDLNDWAKTSRAFLGTVGMIAEKSERFVTLSVVLESDKKDILTVVNPKEDSVRLGSGDLLEVVVSDDLSKSNEWNFEFIPNELGVVYEKCGEQAVGSSVIYTNNVRRRNMDVEIPETHFWFRPTWDSKMCLSTLNNGTYKAGKIVFNSKNNCIRELELSIWIKNKKLTTPKIEIVSEAVARSLVNLQHREYDIKSNSTTTTTNYHTNTYSRNYNEFPDRQEWSKYCTKYEKWDSNRRKNVVLEEKKAESLESGCKVCHFEVEEEKEDHVNHGGKE